jgi:nitroreductase
MKVSEAVDSRLSCRAFLPRPVLQATLVSILEGAKRAPSGGNLQPWHVYALTGEPLRNLLADIRGALPEHRFKCGEDMYATIGVPREDKPARLRQFARNYELFGAPSVLFFAIDRQMGLGQWADLGMFMQTVMLLAREHGLHTCAQEAWAVWHRRLETFLSMPPNLMFFCGMALGYADEAAPINSLRTDRAPLQEFATLSGWEDQ